jgi:isochorismate synthase EntC
MHIRAGELGKVVLARDVVATAQAPLDERYLLTQLAKGYPTCWVYTVELLIASEWIAGRQCWIWSPVWRSLHLRMHA